MSDEEILKVVRAAQAGRFEDIERAVIDRHAPTPWIRMDNASLNFNTFVYRLKPKPREFWLTRDAWGNPIILESAPDPDAPLPTPIHVREVLP